MKPKTRPKETQNRDLFRPLLCDIINPHHELTRLTDLIDWSQFDSWSDLFPSKTGRPATAPRLIAGLFYLQHLYGHSDEGVLEAYLQSPYYQHFCGRVYFEHELPIDPSSLVRWRKRLGVKEIEKLLHASIRAALNANMVSTNSFKEVIVDKGYRGHAVTDTKVYIAGQRRGMTASLKKKLKRRSAIEPTIGHMKTEGRLNRCSLKGDQGDSVFALLCGASQNLRLLLKFLRALFFRLGFWVANEKVGIEVLNYRHQNRLKKVLFRID